MKINENFILRKISNQYMAVPVGESAKRLRGVIALNESAAFIWNCLKQDLSLEGLIQVFLSEYEVDYQTAENTIIDFLEQLKSEGVLNE